MMTPLSNLKTATWWKRILYFIPFLLATIGLIIWYMMKPTKPDTPMTVAMTRGEIINREVESTIDLINDLEQSIHETIDHRRAKINELRELASKRGIHETTINRAIASNDFSAITRLISTEFSTSTREDN